MGRNWSKRKREKKQFHSKSVQRMIVKPGMNVPTLSFSPLAAAAAAAVIYIYLYYKTGWYMHMQLRES